MYCHFLYIQFSLLFNCSCCRLLEPDCSLLRLLGNPLPYEVAVGLNGRIWIKGRSIKETLELANLITQSEHWSVDELKRAIKRLANSLAGF